MLSRRYGSAKGYLPDQLTRKILPQSGVDVKSIFACFHKCYMDTLYGHGLFISSSSWRLAMRMIEQSVRDRLRSMISSMRGLVSISARSLSPAMKATVVPLTL